LPNREPARWASPRRSSAAAGEFFPHRNFPGDRAASLDIERERAMFCRHTCPGFSRLAANAVNAPHCRPTNFPGEPEKPIEKTPSSSKSELKQKKFEG
jgi:hypothetical protein